MALGVFNLFKQKDLPKADEPISQNQDVRYLELVLRKWLDSPVRKEQLLAEKYYDGDHDILRREKKVIGADGNLVTIENVANNGFLCNLHFDFSLKFIKYILYYIIICVKCQVNAHNITLFTANFFKISVNGSCQTMTFML